MSSCGRGAAKSNCTRIIDSFIFLWKSHCILKKRKESKSIEENGNAISSLGFGNESINWEAGLDNFLDLSGYLGKIRYLEGLELSEEELGDEGADKGGGNLLLGMAPVINKINC